MAKTQVPGGYIEDDAITTAKIADNTIQVAHLHSSHGITTNNIAEHTNNKYYTDARVDTRLAATKSANFVTTGNILVNSDSNYIKLGSGDDLFIKHNGTDSYIENYTGHLYIKNNTNDADILLQTDDGSGGVTTYLTIDGSSEVTFASKPITFFDNIKANFGNSSDLQIYHDGSNSIVQEVGTGDLRLAGNVVRIRNSADTENMIAAVQDGAVTLCFNGNGKLSTTSTGVSVTGALTASGDATIYNKLTFSYNDHYLQTGTNSISFKNSGGTSYATLNNTGLSVTNNLTVGGNLTVNGTSTTISTATLDVEDKNITLNKGSGDTSSTADGAGITIQDAVDASNDASLTWNAAGDKFVTSHPLDVTGALTSTTINTGQGATEVYLMNQNVRTSDAINFASYQVGGTSVIGSDRTMNNIPAIEITNAASNSYGFIEMLGTAGAYIDLKNSSSDDYDMRLISYGTGGEIVSGSGDIVIKRQGATKLSTSAAGIVITGTINSAAITSTGIVTGTQLKSATSSTSAAVLKLEDTGVATYDFSFPDTSTILLGVNDQSGTTSNKVLKLLNAGSGTLGLNVEGAATFNSTISSGAISSGAITTTGFFNIHAAHTVYAGIVNTTSTATTSYNVIRFTQGSGSGAPTGLIGTAGSAVGNTAFRSGMNIGTQTSGSLNFIINDGLAARIDTSGNFQMGTTTVIDSSKNLTNIGTISSGAITSTGLNSTSGTVQFADASSAFDSSDASGYARFTHTNGSAQIGLFRAGGSAGGSYLGADSSKLLRVYNSSFAPKFDINTSGDVTATGNIQHTGLTMTSGTDIDQLITATDSLTLSDAWQDTSIAGSDLASGTYIVQVYVNDYGVGGGHYQEFYSGTMSWTSASTNSTEVDEIILHRAGHAPNAGDIYLRTERRLQSGDSGTLMLQIRGSTSNSGASNYIFKFRRMI